MNTEILSNDERRMESRAEALREPLRLDRYLAERFTYLSRNAWQKEIDAGRVAVNGQRTSSHRKIRNGDLVAYAGSPGHEPDIDARYEVIFENGDALVVSKSGNIPVHPAGPYFKNTLLTILERSYGGKLYMVHRLDRETSGCIIFAKSGAAAHAFHQALNAGHKEYLALVRGTPPSTFENATPLGLAYAPDDPRTDIVRKKRAAFAGAEESAYTAFATIEQRGEIALVRAMPETGRLHQIRAHLLHCGFPIVGDKIYGTDERIYLRFIKEGLSAAMLQELGMERCALHCHRITLHPEGYSSPLVFEAAMPEDMRNFFAQSAS